MFTSDYELFLSRSLHTQITSQNREDSYINCWVLCNTVVTKYLDTTELFSKITRYKQKQAYTA